MILVLLCLVSFVTIRAQISTSLTTPFLKINISTSENLLQEEWMAFRINANKTYNTPEEERLRREIYIENRRRVVIFNQEYGLGIHSYVLQVNDFSDMLPHEFNTMVNGFKVDNVKRSSLPRSSLFLPSANVVFPEHVDWREAGAVTSVKNQGACASCYAFAAAGALEGQYFRKSGNLVELSPQDVMDCSRQFGNDGCQGGFTESSFEYAKANPGLNILDSYPYEARDAECRFRPEAVGGDCTGYGYIPSGDEEALKAAVATMGPVAVAMDASGAQFQFYKEGIYYNPSCKNGEEDLNHAVLVVGYGTEPDGKKYWLVKNSYGSGWGNGGYFKILRDANNHCGIATYARYPLV